MNKLILYFVCLLVSGFTSCSKGDTQKTLLHIVAHPDDEMAIADVLVKYSKMGYRVIVMIATDGEYGTRVTTIPEGDSLAKVRKLESICGCEKMGIEPPVFLSLERLDTKIGVRNYFNLHKQLRAALIEKIATIKPDIIITFGPDGDSHHSEHIVVGSAVTEVLLQQGWVDKYPLYYIAYNKSNNNGGELGYMDDRYINVEIKYSAEDELKGLDANRCFVSQLTKEELDADRVSKLADTSNTSFFRRFAVNKEKHKEFH
jgi:LmbE family N-acetylglucosaminyl deacetylase